MIVSATSLCSSTSLEFLPPVAGPGSAPSPPAQDSARHARDSTQRSATENLGASSISATYVLGVTNQYRRDCPGASMAEDATAAKPKDAGRKSLRKGSPGIYGVNGPAADLLAVHRCLAVESETEVGQAGQALRKDWENCVALHWASRGQNLRLTNGTSRTGWPRTQSSSHRTAGDMVGAWY